MVFKGCDNNALENSDVADGKLPSAAKDMPAPVLSSANASTTIAEAFAEHKDVLASFLAQKMLRPSDIEDVLQETFLRTFNASRKSEISSPKGYMFIVARNLLSRSFAKQSREMIREISDAEFTQLPSQTVQTDMQVHYKMKLNVLEKSIETLPPQCRRVFLLRKIYGKSQKQIAKELGISTSTVERHITIALTRLNGEMKSHGYNQEEKTVIAAASHSNTSSSS